MSKINTPAMEKYYKKIKKGKKDKTSPFSEVWKRLKRNKLAMIGLSIFTILVIIAIFPGLFTRYEYDAQNYMEKLQLPSSIT